MKIRLGELRKIIREEVERNLRATAGFFGDNISQPRKSIGSMPLPGLGANTEYKEEHTGEHEEEEERATDSAD